jgi:hypothetical protein
MTEQKLGRIFEDFLRKVFEDNSFEFEFEKNIAPKPAILLSQNISVSDKKLRFRKNFYQPDFVINNTTWIECTTKIENAQKKELLYAHQCDKLIILYLYKSSVYIEPLFQNTTYLLIDDYLEQLGFLLNYNKELKKLKSE